MTQKEAEDILFERMGNDYYFLPTKVKEAWIAEIMAETFFTEPRQHPETVAFLQELGSPTQSTHLTTDEVMDKIAKEKK